MSIDLIDYLRDIYLPIYYEFAYFSIKNHYNFKVRITSYIEGSYNVLKRFLKNHQSNLFTLLQVVEKSFRYIEENYYRQVYKQTSKKVIKYTYYIIGRLYYQVSFAGLSLIY